MRLLWISSPRRPRWDDLEALCGARGDCRAGSSSAGNRAALAASVASGAEPGLLAYVGGQPVG